MTDERAILTVDDKDKLSINYNGQAVLENSTSPSIASNITGAILYLNTIFLIFSIIFRSPLYFVATGFLSLLYYIVGPHINRTHFESFKLTYQLAMLKLQYSSKQGELKNIEEAEIVKQTVTKTISAKARIINPKDVKKLNK